MYRIEGWATAEAKKRQAAAGETVRWLHSKDYERIALTFLHIYSPPTRGHRLVPASSGSDRREQRRAGFGEERGVYLEGQCGSVQISQSVENLANYSTSDAKVHKISGCPLSKDDLRGDDSTLASARFVPASSSLLSLQPDSSTLDYRTRLYRFTTSPFFSASATPNLLRKESMKLDATDLRYISADSFRVLAAVRTSPSSHHLASHLADSQSAVTLDTGRTR
jgi:hypothetical protein